MRHIALLVLMTLTSISASDPSSPNEPTSIPRSLSTSRIAASLQSESDEKEGGNSAERPSVSLASAASPAVASANPVGGNVQSRAPYTAAEIIVCLI